MRYIKFLKNKDVSISKEKPLSIIKWIEDDLVIVGTDSEHLVDYAVRIVLDVNNTSKPYQISSVDKNTPTGGNIHFDMSLIGKNISDVS